MVSSKFINEVFNLWIIMALEYISPEATAKGFRSAVYPVEWLELIVMSCGMTVKRRGMTALSVRKMKVLV